MIYFIVKTILVYFEYPTKIDVSYASESQQYFPAFSICNGLAMRFDQFIGPFLNYTNKRNLTDTNDTTTISAFQAQYIADFIQEMFHGNKSLEPLFFSLPSMLISCSFNAKQCSATDFISFTSPTYGICYTFNAKIENSPDNSVRHANQHGGESIGFVALIHDNIQAPHMEAAGIELMPGRKHKLSYKKKTTLFSPSP
ncbi:unnamed protein product [Rotaria sp. Silwood2]|nr:unnamed protein product [Rotaria sp. Silwood2]